MQEQMIWSDNIWIEGNKGWFVAGEYNAVFEIDWKKKNYSLLSNIPTKKRLGLRVNPICIKMGNQLYCLPDQGRDIWIYNMTNDSWLKVEVSNPEKCRLEFIYLGKFQSGVMCFSRGLQKVFLIKDNCELQEILNLNVNCGKHITKMIKVHDCLYGISDETGCIFEYLIGEKQPQIYTNSDLPQGLSGICFDGDKFWMSGNKKEIYVWEKTKNQVTMINNFPKKFGVYYKNEEGKVAVGEIEDDYNLPIFIDLVYMNDTIWLFPFQTNDIITINKNDINKVTLFKIESEEEDGHILWEQKAIYHKYLHVYDFDERYIGLFSLKNDMLLEIDSQVKKYKYLPLHYTMGNKAIENNDSYCEKNKEHRWFYTQDVCQRKRILDKNESCVGKYIWDTLSQR